MDGHRSLNTNCAPHASRWSHVQATKQQSPEAMQAHVQQQAQQVLALGAQLKAAQQQAEVAQQQAQLKLAELQQEMQESAAKLAGVMTERSQLQEDLGRWAAVMAAGTARAKPWPAAHFCTTAGKMVACWRYHHSPAASCEWQVAICCNCWR